MRCDQEAFGETPAPGQKVLRLRCGAECGLKVRVELGEDRRLVDQGTIAHQKHDLTPGGAELLPTAGTPATPHLEDAMRRPIDRIDSGERWSTHGVLLSAMVWLMTSLDVSKLRTIARNLSDYGTALSSRTSPPDAEMMRAMGQAFIDISEAIGDLATKERP